MSPNGRQWERKTHLLTGRKHQQNQAQGGGHLSLGANRSWNPTCSHLSVGAPAESLPFISPAFPAQLNFTVNISVSLDVGRRQHVSQNEFQETKSSVKCLKLSATPPPFCLPFPTYTDCRLVTIWESPAPEGGRPYKRNSPVARGGSLLLAAKDHVAHVLSSLDLFICCVRFVGGGTLHISCM